MVKAKLGRDIHVDIAKFKVRSRVVRYWYPCCQSDNIRAVIYGHS